MAQDTEIILEGLVFPECPRWHEGKLWFSDMQDRKVLTLDLDGKTETVLEVPGQPAGLGWIPNGRLLVVSMTDRRLLRLDPGGLTEVANLDRLATGHCNDMVVDGTGRAYVGNFGGNSAARSSSKATADLVMVGPEGDSRIVARRLVFPNGMAITPDGHTLIVAESFARRLAALEIKKAGSLTRRRVWAELDEVIPDGICLDAAGGVWAANAGGNQVVRVLEGGEVTHRVETSNNAYACMLGGPDRRTLFALTAKTYEAGEPRAKRTGRIETIRVDIPGAGLP